MTTYLISHRTLGFRAEVWQGKKRIWTTIWRRKEDAARMDLASAIKIITKQEK